MRRLIISAALFGIILGTFGCESAREKSSGSEFRIVSSFFPMYLFAANIARDIPGVSVELLIPPQMGCPHNYDLTPEDLKQVGRANVYVMNGAGLESFGVDQIKNANPAITIIDSSSGIEAITLHDHDEHDDHDHGDDHEHDHHHHASDVNPHFFSSPREAAKQVRAIAEGLARSDPEHASRYRENADAYARRLEEVAKELVEASKGFENEKIVTMHEVFDYLARDCGLEVVGTIQGTAGQEPSSARMRTLIDKIKEVKPGAIFTEPQYNRQVAATIASESGVPIEELDPVASGPPNAPLDYYERRMNKNLAVLIRTLGNSPK